ncbi:CHAT domain-containing protein [Candidatus Poribacteria bacterium]|nr:CHAT domain-containing protein [Candidatus Poribacteria bacterium]
MYNISESEVLTVIRAQVRQGAYREATNYADTLPSEVKNRPLVALERLRTFLRQGHPINAEAALTAANLALATPGERLILAIEAAALRIYRDVAIREAIKAAEAAFAEVENAPMDAAARAEAERIYVRIILIAATYYEIGPEEGNKGRDRLPALAQQLERAGRIDEALAARFTYAERLETLSARLEALAKLADEAVKADHPNLGGEAHVVRADQLLTAGAPNDEIRAALDTAAALYAEINHLHGPIDVRRIRANLAIERELASPDALEACLEAYRRLDFHRGTLNVLMDLSQLAHDRGDTVTAAAYRQQTISLSKNVGMGLVRDSFQTAQIDLLMRHHDYGAAIELCQTAIATEPPAMSKAGYEQLLATAYSFINDLDAACIHSRKAIEMFEVIGAIDSASDAVMKLTSDLSSYRREDAWDEAEVLLDTWSVKDEERGDFAAAVNKREMIAQVKIQRFLYSPVHQGELALLDKAEQAIERAEELAHHLPEREAVRRLGNLQQLRGQIYQGRGDEERVIQTWRDALAIYESAGFGMEIANCHYILGTIYLNRANQELMPNFGESENNLREALTYYDSAGMRGQAADTRFMFARLYTNASIRVHQDLSTQMLDAALGHLLDGETDYDAIRREFNAGRSVLDVQRGKHALIDKSQRIYALALEILCLFRPAPNEAWNWAQRAKARALSDVLGMGSVPPARVMSGLERHPDSVNLVIQERELTTRISKVPPENRMPLRQELNMLWEQMVQHPQLSEYLELRMGTALDAADLEGMMIEDAEAGRSWVCIDWIAVNERLFLLALRPGQHPQLIPLPLQLSTVRAFVSNNLAPETFRSNLRDTPELLRELDPLIAPLADLSHPGELLILSPTGPLFALPLHALEIDANPLLVRNPIVYCPSLSVLRHCLARRGKGQERPTAALFGDPRGNRSEAARLVAHLEQLFETKPFIKEEVTRTAFMKSIAGCDFVHFQGHAEHKPSTPLDSYLALADGDLTAREVFGLPDLRAELVTLAACESAANVIATGDEPLGLIPAFLYAGANSVLATLWKVSQTSAAQTMQLFYDTLTDSDKIVDKAQALRRAMLAVRDTPGFDSPYHWAPFVLHGDWQ